MIRAVLDCNVIVSSLIQPRGPSARIVGAIAKPAFECVISQAILNETRRVLRYPRLKRRIPLSTQEQEAFLGALSILAVWVEDVKGDQALVIEDPSDDVYLLAAVGADAGFVVTGDEHLLRLKDHQGVAIVTPRLFLEILER